MRNKIITISLIWIVGLGVLRVGGCGHNHPFSSIAGPELAAHAERDPAAIKVKNLRS